MSTAFDFTLDYVAGEIAASLYMIDPKLKQQVSEIRIRVNKPISLVCSEKNLFLSIDGAVGDRIPSNALVTNRKSIDESFLLVCNNSVYAHEQELANAFITLENGGRVGVFGEAIYDGNKITAYKNITSLNYRIPREVIGCAEPIKKVLLDSKGIIICGPPASSKTTMLRDSIRLLAGNECGYKRVCVIDTRNEIAAIKEGKMRMDLGVCSDVISLACAELGIETAIRVMNPQYLAIDEIMSDSETNAIIKGSKCGVKLIATMHTGDIDELMKKNSFISLFNNDAIDSVVFVEKVGAEPKVIKLDGGK